MTSESPRVEAYVLRFVFDGGDPSNDSARVTRPAGWRGVIIRVQDNTEKPFMDFADAVAFIARDVRIGDFVFQQARDEGRAELDT